MRSGGGLSRRRTKKTRIGWMLHARLRKWSKSLGEEAVQKDPVTRQHDVKPDTDRDRWSYIPMGSWTETSKLHTKPTNVGVYIDLSKHDFKTTAKDIHPLGIVFGRGCTSLERT